MDQTGKFTAQPVFTLNPSDEPDLLSFFRVVIPYLLNRRLHLSLIFTDVLLGGRWAKEVVGKPDDLHCLVVEREMIADQLPVISRATDIVFVISSELATADISTFALTPNTYGNDPVRRAESFYSQVKKASLEREIWACVLIGGKSSRMGSPKHLLTTATGETWLERAVAILSDRLDGVVISGSGDVPSGMDKLVRLTDVPDGQGPLAGIVSAMRWRPDVSWLVIACDMPGVTGEAVDWLLGTRQPGRWATVPQIEGQKWGEPLFALYNPPCGLFFERMLVEEYYAIQGVCRNSRVDFVQIPEELKSAWSNVNTPEQLEGFNRGK